MNFFYQMEPINTKIETFLLSEMGPTNMGPTNIFFSFHSSDFLSLLSNKYQKINIMKLQIKNKINKTKGMKKVGEGNYRTETKSWHPQLLTNVQQLPSTIICRWQNARVWHESNSPSVSPISFTLYESILSSEHLIIQSSIAKVTQRRGHKDNILCPFHSPYLQAIQPLNSSSPHAVILYLALSNCTSFFPVNNIS